MERDDEGHCVITQNGDGGASMELRVRALRSGADLIEIRLDYTDETDHGRDYTLGMGITQPQALALIRILMEVAGLQPVG